MDKKFDKTHPEAVIAELKRRNAALTTEVARKDSTIKALRDRIDKAEDLIWDAEDALQGTTRLVKDRIADPQLVDVKLEDL